MIPIPPHPYYPRVIKNEKNNIWVKRQDIEVPMLLPLGLGDNQSVGSSAPVVTGWLWPGNRTFLEVASMVVSWWKVAFCSVLWLLMSSSGPECYCTSYALSRVVCVEVSSLASYPDDQGSLSRSRSHCTQHDDLYSQVFTSLTRQGHNVAAVS